jgi:Cellulase (glycosyl hydrolase family 5)
MRRTVAIAVAVASIGLLSALAATSAGAANRMWVGFHDDPSFRWASDRSERIQASADVGASVMRLLVHWNQVAPERPARPADPFDPAYNFGDVDEAVSTARAANLQVLLTLYGTPRWANGGRGVNVMPNRVLDFRRFGQAIAARYSGRHAGYPFVRFWSVWNEPNLQRFLKPQFDKRGKPLAPKNYAKLYAAAYQGIKTGNPKARVAIGETSPRGSDKAKGARAIHSPGKFAELVAKANRRLKFDAWAHHPYPSAPGLKPSHQVRWPNVTLASLPQFQKKLRKWFKRSRLDIWITEYAHQTKPQDRLGVTYAKQAAYIRQSIAIARKQPFTKMFVWFVFRDDLGQPWDSGIYTRAGAAKGSAPAAFSRAARPLDPR